MGIYVEVFFVGFVFVFGVVDSFEEVVFFVEYVVMDIVYVGELYVSVYVDFDDIVVDGIEVFLFVGVGVIVEDEEDGFVVVGFDGGFDVGLVFVEEFRVEFDVVGFVDIVDVVEVGSDGEVGGNGGEGVVDVEDVFGLGVEGVVVDIFVVDIVFFIIGDIDFYFELLFYGSSVFEVGGGGFDVLVDFFFGEIDYVGGEEGFVGGFEVSFVGIEYVIELWEEFFGVVVGVEDDRDVVGRGDLVDEVSIGDGVSDGGSLVSVVYVLGRVLGVVSWWGLIWRVKNYFVGEVSGIVLGYLEDDGSFGIVGSFERGDDGGGGGDVLEGLLVEFVLFGL